MEEEIGQTVSSASGWASVPSFYSCSHTAIVAFVILRRGIAMFALFSVAFAQTDDSRIGRIKKGASGLSDAMLTSNYKAVVDLTYPAIVDLLGGPEKAVGTVQEQMKGIKEQGISITSFTLSDPSEIKTGGSELFAILPATMEMKAPQAKITLKTFLIAISRDQGKSWSYADGSNLTPELMKTFFPKFPPELKLPEKSNVVEKIP
jgi:hypothetical protein